MSHDLLDNDKCVTVGAKPWHNLGVNFTEPISAIGAHDAMGGSFTLYKKQVGVMFDDEFVSIPDNFAIVRGHTNKDAREIVFGFASDHYHLVQPIDIINKFDERVGVSIETMGLIQDGKKLFLTWRLPNFEVVSGDEIEVFGILMIGFDTVFSTRLNIGSTRVVCANTFAMALNEETDENKKKRGMGTIYTSKHSNRNLLGEMGEWMNFIQINSERQSNLLKSLFGKFASSPIVHEKQAEDLIYTTWPNPAPVPEFYPEALRKAKEEKIGLETERLTKMRDGIYMDYTEEKGDNTYWKLFNAGTHFFNYVMPSKKDTSYSLVWGNRNLHMNHFAEVLKKDIENK